MEASALTHASRLGLLTRRARPLRLQRDDRLIMLIRAGHDHAFEALFLRYRSRLFAFCRGMLGSAEDAEDVLQDVFVAAHAAILADRRPINARPWLYRIARNRCLNHLRRPAPEGQDTMDIHPHEHGLSVADRVQERQEFRDLLTDVGDLPDTQRTALLLRELDALSYAEIAEAMETTLPAVKSLLVRARMALAESSQSRFLTCDEVYLELAEAAEGLRKASGPVRAHLKRCERCREYREELRRSGRALAALAPLGVLGALCELISAKVGGTALGGSSASSGSAAAGGGAAAAGSAAAASRSGGAAGLAGGLAATTVGAKAVAGVASVALVAAGAAEVRHLTEASAPQSQAIERPAVVAPGPPASGELHNGFYSSAAAAAAGITANGKAAAHSGSKPAPETSQSEPLTEAGATTEPESSSPPVPVAEEDGHAVAPDEGPAAVAGPPDSTVGGTEGTAGGLTPAGEDGTGALEGWPGSGSAQGEPPDGGSGTSVEPWIPLGTTAATPWPAFRHRAR